MISAMTELLVVIVLVAALVVALQPAHSRAWRPGFDSRIDRDLARQAEEFDFLEAADPVESSEIGQPSVRFGHRGPLFGSVSVRPPELRNLRPSKVSTLVRPGVPGR